MKRLCMSTLAVLALLSISCKKNQPDLQGEQLAAFTVSIPDEIMTKAYSDGTKATDLYYAVYDDAGNWIYGTTNPLSITVGTPKSVDIPVVVGFVYDIVFWAQSPDADCYDFQQTAKTITVKDYAGDANDDDRDAFYQIVEDYTYTTTPTTVKLYRPFAQVNFLASDYTAVGQSMTSSVTIPGLPNVLNVLTGETSGTLDADFSPTSVPAMAGETLGYQDYSYVSMNYVLAPKTKDTVQGDVTGTFYYNGTSVSLSVPNVPYQRNYRTNIFVNGLFTGSANFTVQIVPTYGPDDDQTHEHYPPYNAGL